MTQRRPARPLIAGLVTLLLIASCSSTTELTSDEASTPAADIPRSEPTTAVADPTVLPTPVETPTPSDAPSATAEPQPEVAVFKTGAQIMLQTPERFAGLRVGLIANQASQVDGRSIIDLLHEHADINLVALFAPEHGPRGDLGAGETVPGGVDTATGVTVHSLYGETRKPTPDMMADIDVLLYDMQDVGTRYYTYISTMGLAMQAAAENNVPFVVLDRPLVSPTITSSGFTRDDGQESFVSAYGIPTTYSLTSAELALAIKHQPFIAGLDQLPVSVFPVSGWQPGEPWPASQAWIPPSPGLPTLSSAQTYPATVLFEATGVSYGRGTEHPFGQIGAPWIDGNELAADLNARSLAGVRFEPTVFTPQASPTASDPQFQDETVPGVRLVVEQPGLFAANEVGVHLFEAVTRQADEQGVSLIERPSFFDLLAGTARLRESLDAAVPAGDIVESWAREAQQFDEAMGPWKLYARPL